MMLMEEEAINLWGQEIHEKSLYYTLNFIKKLNCFRKRGFFFLKLKKNIIKKKYKKGRLHKNSWLNLGAKFLNKTQTN